MRRLNLVAALALSSLFANGPATADVLVVDTTGAGDFTDLALAVATANDGDVLLLMTGWTAPLTAPAPVINGKSLTLIGDVGSRKVTTALEIRNLAAHQRVTLRNLEIDGAFALFDQQMALSLSQCDGTVWIEDCTLGAFDGYYASFPSEIGYPGYPAVDAVDCARLVFQRCTLRGGAGGSEGPIGAKATAGAPALRLLRCDATVSDSTFEGGAGGFASTGEYYGDGRFGGAAIDARESHVYGSGGAWTGGDATGSCGLATTCAAGDGVHLDGMSTLHYLDVDLASGVAVAGATAGVPIGGTGTATAFAGSAAGHVVDAPVRETQSASFRVIGEPGSTAGFLLSFVDDVVLVPSVKSVLLLGPPLIGPLVIGTIPASGTYTIAIGVPDLGPTAPESIQLRTQALVDTVSGGRILSAGSAFVIVGAEF